MQKGINSRQDYKLPDLHNQPNCGGGHRKMPSPRWSMWPRPSVPSDGQLLASTALPNQKE
ncbi:hypothetical protein PspLS_04074 [Pyricularia sp. CBS 133598]|nr:hypothetical protein PspLS_04074 [Pyricularia sp. CBS 133598]